MSKRPATAAAVCPNCNGALNGAYCAHCGQAAADSHTLTIAHFLHDLSHETLHVDGKVFRTVKALLCEPGRLTKEYWTGRVASWIRPIRIFLVAAALHLFFAVGIGPANFKVLVEQDAKGTNYVNVSPNPESRAGKNGRKPASPEVQREVLNEFQHYYNGVRYLSPVLFAMLAWALYWRQRPGFAYHLIGALHFYSYWYLLAIVSGELSRLSPYFSAMAVATPIYGALGLRRLFGQSWLTTLGKGFLLGVGLMVVELGLAFFAVTMAEKKLGL